MKVQVSKKTRGTGYIVSHQYPDLTLYVNDDNAEPFATICKNDVADKWGMFGWHNDVEIALEWPEFSRLVSVQEAEEEAKRALSIARRQAEIEFAENMD